MRLNRDLTNGAGVECKSGHLAFTYYEYMITVSKARSELFKNFSKKSVKIAF